MYNVIFLLYSPLHLCVCVTTTHAQVVTKLVSSRLQSQNLVAVIHSSITV